MKEDNKDVQLLKEQLWTRKTIAEITMLERKTMMDRLDIIKEIRKNNTRKREVVQALEKKNGLTWEKEEIVYIDERVYILNNKKIKEKILRENHDLADMEHPGQQRMMELLKRNYWWPGLKEDIKKYVQECFRCQQNKVQHQKKSGELHLLAILQELQ